MFLTQEVWKMFELMNFSFKQLMSSLILIQLYSTSIFQGSKIVHNKRQHTAPAALDSQQVARVCGGRYTGG